MESACSSVHAGGQLGVMWKTVSEDCNLACDYCYYSRTKGKLGHTVRKVDYGILEKFIKEYMNLSDGIASFAWQGGEPLLAGLEFFERVVYLQAKYAPPNTIISNTLQTNGTLISQEWAQFFKRYNFLIGVSMDGPKEIHDRRRVTHRGIGSFDRVMRGIHHLEHYGVEFNILTVLHEENIQHPIKLVDFYESNNFKYIQFIPGMDFYSQEPGKPPKYLISPQEYGDFLCSAFDEWYNNGSPRLSIRFFENILNVYLDHEPDLCIHRKMCPTTLVLEQNGDAYPCDFYLNRDYTLGNVGSDSLEDILGNYVYQQFLSKKPSLPKKCTSCEFLHLCHGGCPRNREWFEDEIHADYFCDSYKQIYSYAHERMETLAHDLRIQRLERHLKTGGEEPGRNELCICGSGLKYKKCCGLVRNEIS